MTEEAAIEAPHGWVCWNDGPGAWFWSEDRAKLVHELSYDIRPATGIEKWFMSRCGGRLGPDFEPMVV